MMYVGMCVWMCVIMYLCLNVYMYSMHISDASLFTCSICTEVYGGGVLSRVEMCRRHQLSTGGRGAGNPPAR